jgi:arylsulfatase A-like enzyme
MWVLVLASCASGPPCGELGPRAAAAQPNFLVVVLDDVGTDQLAAWGIGARTAPTPTIDCLCRRGLRFTTAWSAPLCSPARAELLTGRRSLRTGIGHNTVPTVELADGEITFAEALRAEGYATGYVGKWHLGGFTAPSGADGPNRQGFDHFVGSMGNLGDGASDAAEGGTYDHWLRVRDGDARWTRKFALEDTADEARDFVRHTEPPWALVVAFHAAHTPWTEPPGRLVATAVPRDPPDDVLYRALVEAADTELGRILRAMDPVILSDTLVVVLGDNGTPGDLLDAPSHHGKGTMAEGGLRVPLVVAGPDLGVDVGVTDALVEVADVFPTLLALGGAEAPAAAQIDGASLIPVLSDPAARVHDTLASAVFSFTTPDLRLAVRDDRYKVVRYRDGDERLFAMDSPIEDGPDLLEDGVTAEEQRAYAALRGVMDGLPPAP